jgi:catechol 2,3-dioxygenase-like lactoylglutathione lyase family enzyme
MMSMIQPDVILGLHHAQITVPASMEAAAVQFYTEVLGLREIEKPDSLKDRGGTWFDLDGQQIHLAIEDGVNRRATKAHLAYLVGDLDYWRKRLIENEVSPIDSVPIPGYDRFEARDPFGNRIEFIQRIG